MGVPFNCLGAVIIFWLLNTSQRVGAELLEGLIGNQLSWKAYDGGGDVDLCCLCSQFLCSRLNIIALTNSANISFCACRHST